MADFGWDGTPDLARLIGRRLGRIYSHLEQACVSVCKSLAQIESCRAKSSDLYVDVAVLKSSHKYVLWILGLFAIMALSFVFVFGLSVLTILRSLK